jgi:hypothetical protein
MAYENVDGKVARLYTNREACNVRLDSHGERYFGLKLDHPNYNAIYALLVAAAVNRYTIRLRLESFEPPDPPSSTVEYIVVDWPQG